MVVLQNKMDNLKYLLLGFTDDSVVKNLPANTGDTVNDFWSEKIPPAAEQLGLYATTIEAVP